MSKHSHIEPCHKELKGIVMSHMPPACQDVVWLQPVKPGLFRWMVPTPYKNHTWMPVAVEQPIPKNALLSYFYDKIQENSISPFKFYSESETEALLGAYIYDECGNVSMQGMLDFHCDGDQEENKVYFDQSVKDYESGISTYIKQFYDRIILSIESSDGEHSLILSKDGLYYNNSIVMTEDLYKDSAVTSLKAEVEAFDYNDASYSLMRLSPAVATTGDVTITGGIEPAVLQEYLTALISNGDLLRHYKESYHMSGDVPTVDNSVDIDVKYNGILASTGLWAVDDLGSYDKNDCDWVTDYIKSGSTVPGSYACLYTENEDSDLRQRSSVQTFPDYIKFAVDCGNGNSSDYYSNIMVIDREKILVRKDLRIEGNLYLGDVCVDGAVTSVTASADETDGCKVLTLNANPSTGEVRITGGIDKTALVSLINKLLEDGDVVVPENNEPSITGGQYSGIVKIAKDVAIVTGSINSDVTFEYEEIPVAGHETHFILQSNGAHMVSIPSGYNAIDGNATQSVSNNQWIEMNYVSDGEKVYVRSIVN